MSQNSAVIYLYAVVTLNSLILGQYIIAKGEIGREGDALCVSVIQILTTSAVAERWAVLYKPLISINGTRHRDLLGSKIEHLYLSGKHKKLPAC